MKKFDLVIKNGTVVTASDMFSADLGVKDGKIAAIADVYKRQILYKM